MHIDTYNNLRKIAGGIPGWVPDFVRKPIISYKTGRNRVMSDAPANPQEFSTEVLNTAANKFYNTWTPEQRRLFSVYDTTDDSHLNDTDIDRSPLESEFGSSWIPNKRPMCNAVVASVIQRATGKPVLTDPNSGQIYTVNQLNKMFAPGKDYYDVNGYRFYPISWDEAKNTNSIVLDPTHMGIRIRRPQDEGYGTLNASYTKGLMISDYGDPASTLTRHKDKTRYFRFEPIPKPVSTRKAVNN